VVPCPGHISVDRLAGCGIPAEAAKALAREYAAALPDLPSYAAGWIRLEEADADAARAYGCLLELTEDEEYGYHAHAASFICDPAFAVERIRAAIAARAEQERERAEARGSIRAGTDASAIARAHAEAAGEDLDALSDEERTRRLEEAEAEVRRSQRAEAEATRLSAARANLELGRRLSERCAELPLDRDLVEVAVLMVLEAAGRELGDGGLRMVHPQTTRIERKTLADGTVRERPRTEGRGEGPRRARATILAPGSAEDVLRRLVMAVAADALADQDALAQSDRSWSRVPQEAAAKAIEILGEAAIPEPMRERARTLVRRAASPLAPGRADAPDLEPAEEGEEGEEEIVGEEPPADVEADATPDATGEAPAPADPGADVPEVAADDDAEERAEALGGGPEPRRAPTPERAWLSEVAERVGEDAFGERLPPVDPGTLGPPRVPIDQLSAAQAEWAVEVCREAFPEAAEAADTAGGAPDAA